MLLLGYTFCFLHQQCAKSLSNHHQLRRSQGGKGKDILGAGTWWGLDREQEQLFHTHAVHVQYYNLLHPHLF